MASQLVRRIAFTLGALLIYQIGTHVPLPGIDPAVWARVSATSGGVPRSLGLLSLTLTPYLTAALLAQMLVLVSHRLRSVADAGERGRQRFERYVRGGAIALAAFQSYGIATGLQRIGGVVESPGPLFVISTVLTLTAGVLFLVWLAEQITLRGIGNGLALILFVGIATRLPDEVANTLSLYRIGAISPAELRTYFLLAVAVVVVIVVMERAERRLPVRFAARYSGGRTFAAQSSHLIYKVNPAGILPISIAALVLSVAVTAISVALFYVGGDRMGPTAGAIISVMAPGEPANIAVMALVAGFLVLLYTAFVCDPAGAAEKLKRRGGTIVDVPPGEPTAEYLDGTLTRLATIGAVYLVVVVLLADVLALRYPHVPYYIGGVATLILVCVPLDIAAYLHAYRQRHDRTA